MSDKPGQVPWERPVALSRAEREWYGAMFVVMSLCLLAAAYSLTVAFPLSGWHGTARTIAFGIALMPVAGGTGTALRQIKDWPDNER